MFIGPDSFINNSYLGIRRAINPNSFYRFHGFLDLV